MKHVMSLSGVTLPRFRRTKLCSMEIVFKIYKKKKRWALIQDMLVKKGVPKLLCSCDCFNLTDPSCLKGGQRYPLDSAVVKV